MVLPKEAGPGGPGSESAITLPYSSLKHHRFVADSKDKEPEVVFIGDSLVQLMHQCEVRPISLLLPHPGLPSLTRLDQTSGQAEYGVPEIASGSTQHPEFQCKDNILPRGKFMSWLCQAGVV